MLARPDDQASLSHILVGVPNTPRFTEPRESFCPAEQGSGNHSFRTHPQTALSPAALSRPSSPTSDPHRMVDLSSKLWLKEYGSYTLCRTAPASSSQEQHGAGGSDAEAESHKRASCRYQSQRQWVRTMKFASSPLSSCSQTRSTFNEF